MTMLFHISDYNYVMFFNRDNEDSKYKVAILLKSNDELKISYILSLGCFSNGLLEIRKLDEDELTEVSKLKQYSRDKNFNDYLKIFDNIKNLLDVVYFYAENDVILLDVLEQLESGIQVIAAKSNVVLVSNAKNTMKEDRLFYATKPIEFK